MIKQTKEINIKCFNCGYGWNTYSVRAYVSCPNCMSKVRNQLIEIKAIKKAVTQ